MIIAVLGGGNGSHAAVVDLSLRGHEVRWWRRAAAFPACGRLRYRTFDGSGEITPALLTHDLATAVNGSDLVVAPVPASAQPEVLAQLAPLLAAGQAVAFTPGTFGTWLGARLRSDVAFLETGTLPYLTRVTGPGEVSIPVIASRLPVGSIPRRGHLTVRARHHACAGRRADRVARGARPARAALAAGGLLPVERLDAISDRTVDLFMAAGDVTDLVAGIERIAAAGYDAVSFSGELGPDAALALEIIGTAIKTAETHEEH